MRSLTNENMSASGLFVGSVSRRTPAIAFVVLLLRAVLPDTVAAAESVNWPGWRGPQRNGTSLETGWAQTWPGGGPKILWQAAVGKGFSALAVADGRAFTMGNTDNVDTVFCLDAATGKVLWKHSYPCPLTPLSYQGGPSATPAVDQQRVYTLSKSGDLFCLDVDNGQIVWSKKFAPAPRKEGDYQVDWGYAGSPLIVGPQLFLSVGWAAMALDKSTGRVLWDNGPGRPGYSSPVPFSADGRECLALLVARGVVATDAASGHIRWTIPWRTTWDQNAPDVLVSERKLFVSTGHGVGCALFDIAGRAPQEIWRNKNMKNELSSSVLYRECLYGFDKDRLACIDWNSGASRWTEPGLGRGSLILVDGHLIIVGERGRLVLAKATPEAYRVLGELQLPAGERYWTAPAFSAGRIFVRNAVGDVMCVDVRK